MTLRSLVINHRRFGGYGCLHASGSPVDTMSYHLNVNQRICENVIAHFRVIYCCRCPLSQAFSSWYVC
jgi:hypothetical protein